MGIERMTFVEVGGELGLLDDVLECCLRSGVFQPQNAARLSEYSIGTSALIRNPYGGLLVKIGEIGSRLKLPLTYKDYDALDLGQNSREDFVREADEYLSVLRQEYPKYFHKKHKLQEETASYRSALEMLERVGTPDINFDELFSGAFLKVRFGKLPTIGLAALEQGDDKPFALHKLSEEGGYTWCIYLTAQQFGEEVDALMAGAGFTRLRIPDYVHGTAADALSFIRSGLEEELRLLKQADEEIDAFVRREKDRFMMVYSRAKFLHDAYDLRKYVVTTRGVFHLIGYLLTREEDRLLPELGKLQGIRIEVIPAEESESRLKAPVQLRNNWFTRPFEMFVSMYGSPSYRDIDPTPFVAYTYSLLFGVMFGDVGQGLCIFLLGLFLSRKKKMALGGIMSRIGVSSMIFGAAYGSVFGFEHLLDPVYRALGFHEKPIEVMHPDTTTKILIAAVGLGAAIILMVILFNIIIGIKHRDYDRVFLSQNGLAGLVFYGAALFAAVSAITGNSVLTLPYGLVLIALPLLVIFFREPIIRFVHIHNNDTLIHRSKTLQESASADFSKVDADIPSLFSTRFLHTRFGRIPTDSYQKLEFYKDEPFMLYPIKTDREYIWCIYAMADGDKQTVDAIFHDLYFERIYIPEQYLKTNEQAETFIRAVIEGGQKPAASEEEGELEATAGEQARARRKTIFQYVFPDGVGAFITESFFELFEVLLSFVTNTMSFLRVGGFILSHAGMMSVVFTLSEMVGAGASPLVIIIGNLFVMGLEGLIVGIQALRLEFYEMFSRFYDAEGEPFTPVEMNYQPKAG